MSRRWIVAITIALSLLAAGTVVVRLDEVNTYDFRTESVKFTSGGNTLVGTLALPPGDGPFGLVAFIHGDGPADDDYDDLYLPIWEALANAGYASISWAKPGVADSTGNWELQTMPDRTDEVLSALRSVEDHPELDPSRVGLIAFSQGGWPLPQVAEQIEIDFAIAIGTAISWRRQGAYDLDTNLRLNGASETARELARTYNEANRKLSSRGASYAEYLDFVEQDLPPMLDRFDYFTPVSADRWEFIRLNTFADATEDLPSLDDTPVLLMLGEEDIHTDVDDTEEVYRRVLGPDCLTVIRKDDTSHAMGKAKFENSQVAAVAQALWQPRGLFADGVLDTIRDFADTHGCTR